MRVYAHMNNSGIGSSGDGPYPCSVDRDEWQMLCRITGASAEKFYPKIGGELILAKVEEALVAYREIKTMRKSIGVEMGGLMNAKRAPSIAHALNARSAGKCLGCGYLGGNLDAELSAILDPWNGSGFSVGGAAFDEYGVEWRVVGISKTHLYCRRKSGSKMTAIHSHFSQEAQADTTTTIPLPPAGGEIGGGM